MLEMDQYELIRTLNRSYEKSIREISRETGHHRKTIRKALTGKAPAYRRTKDVLRPVIGPFLEIIKDWLIADRDAPKKQQHTGQRIYDRLVEEHGYKGSSRTVRKYVRELKRSLGVTAHEIVIPLEPDIGEAEMDWGEATVELSGERVKVKMFCMRSRFSGKPFVRLYHNERQQMFFDGHMHAFAYYGGVFPTIIYDNLKTAVHKVFRGSKRQEQKSFQNFRSYYTFEAKYCGVAKGNEKGGVEGLVGQFRRNFLVPIPKVETLDELNALLLEKCEAYGARVLGGREDRRTIQERAVIEQKALLSLQAPYENTVLVPAKVNKYQMIKADGNSYSVPETSGRHVQVHLTCESVEVYDQGKLVAEHARSFRKGQWTMNPLHYLTALAAKVRAFPAAMPIRQWRPSWPSTYERLLAKLIGQYDNEEGTRAFIKVLQLHKSYKQDAIEAAIDLAWEHGLYHADAIKNVLDQLLEDDKQDLDPLSTRELQPSMQVSVEPPDIAKFDQLLEVAQ